MIITSREYNDVKLGLAASPIRTTKVVRGNYDRKFRKVAYGELGIVSGHHNAIFINYNLENPISTLVTDAYKFATPHEFINVAGQKICWVEKL